MGTARILIVDDDSFYRELLSYSLLGEGYQVTSAVNGVDALRKLAAQSFDIVLLDILMPELGGFDTLREIRKTHPLDTLPIIMVTADDSSEDMVKALDLGASDYITKTLDLAVALARIATHLTLKRFAETYKAFLGIASHDLKKPLTVILDVLDALREEYPPEATVTAELHDWLDILRRSALHMQSMVKDFLELRALEDGRLALVWEMINLNALAEQVVQANTLYAGRKAQQLCLDLEPALPAVPADAGRVLQVLENLVGNAIKFSLSGALTTVRTRRAAAQVVFEVQDSGPGLTEQDLENMTRGRFTGFSNKPTGQETSTGLGLPICKQIIERHGGELGARNNSPQPGATFWFCLPLAQSG